MGLLDETFKTRGSANALATSKGGFILHMLRSLMWDPQTNDRDFRAMMQDYIKKFANRAVSSEDFIALVEHHMKPMMDLDGNHTMQWFFHEWLYGTDVPSYRLEYSLTPDAGGKQQLSGKLTQSGVSEEFKMAVPIFADFAGKNVRVGVMPVRGNSTKEFKVLLPEKPKRVLLNLNHDILTDKEEVKLMK
jgi:aminopeptidase N